MAKKSFKGGLDNLLASAGIKKKIEEKTQIVPEKKEVKTSNLTEDEKHWLLIKIDDLNKELALWRTGKLSVAEFQESIKKFGLSYNASTNEFIEK